MSISRESEHSPLLPSSSTNTSKSDIPGVSYGSWGIFRLAYQSKPSRPRFSSLSGLREYRELLGAFVRLIRDLWRLSPVYSALYYVSNLWLIIAPAASLYCFYFLILSIEDKRKLESPAQLESAGYTVVFSWLACGLLSHLAKDALRSARIGLGGRSRAYFIPKFVKVSLRCDMDEIDGKQHSSASIAGADQDALSKESILYLPYAHDYGNLIPGWQFFDDFFTRIKNLSIPIANAVVFMAMMRRRQTLEIVVGCTILTTLALILPTDGARGKGYTFWSENDDYNRLMVLFNIAFEREYRTSVIRDGLVEMVIQEYQDLSDKLGAVNADVWILGWGIPPSSWYCRLVHVMISDYPMTFYAFLALYLSYGIGTLALFQYALCTMQSGIELYVHAYRRDSFSVICSRIQRFYESLDKPHCVFGTTINYPNLEDNHATGMKISAQDVTYTYPTPRVSALANLNLEIRPGQMVLITGTNGSGKTTLVKLLAGILKPSKGSIVIDGIPLSSYNPVQLRQSIVFLGQSETIYPVSLKENIIMGLGLPDRISLSDLDQKIQEAVNYAGAAEIMDRLSYDTVINPCSINGYSINETPGECAVQALRHHFPTESIDLSSGECQRISAARALFRAMNGENVKLIVIDEATNALDPIAERELMTNFKEIAKKRGQTLVVVTHRLSTLAQDADLIVCMNEGVIEGQGTHDSLRPSVSGYYPAPFHS